MRIRAALLSLALVAAQAPPAPPEDEGRAVIAALLAHEAAVRGPEGGAETCVNAMMAAPPTAAGTDDDDMMPPNAVRIRFQWHEAPPPARVRPPPPAYIPGQRHGRRPAPEPIPAPPALAQTEAARLDALRAEAVPAIGAAAVRQLDADLVPAPLYLRRGYEDCAALTLSRPAFANNVAFVETGFACGGLCGNGSLYALERRDGRWQIVGVADIWIS
jgi:hypothetical protein